MHSRNIPFFLLLIGISSPLLHGMQGNKPLYNNGIVSFRIDKSTSIDAILVENKLVFVIQDNKRLGHEGTQDLCNKVYRFLVGKEKPENILLYTPRTTYEICAEQVYNNGGKGSIIHKCSLNGLVEIEEPSFMHCGPIQIDKFFFAQNLSSTGLIDPTAPIKLYPAILSLKPTRF